MVTSYELYPLIQDFCSATGRKRRNLEAKIATQIPRLKSLARVNNHLYFDAYDELLNDVIYEVLETVCSEYDPSQGNLATWINEIKRLKYRVNELYPKPKADDSHSHEIGQESPESKHQSAKQEYNQIANQSSKRPDSLSRMVGQGGYPDSGASYEDFLADPTLSGLDALIAAEPDTLSKAGYKPVCKLIAYLKSDPDQILQRRIPKRLDNTPCPACSDHELAKLLYLDLLENGESLDEAKFDIKITKLAEQYKINYNTLYSRIKHPVRPGTIQNFILGFGVEFGLVSDKLKAAIEADQDELLSTCAIKNHPGCNGLFLAQRRLPLLIPSPLSFEAITQEVNQAYGYTLKPRQVENHWQNYCYPRLGQLARSLGYQTFLNAGVES